MSKKRRSKETQDIVDTINAPIEEEKEYNFEQVVSTGSTWLDLAISGGVTRYGGVPGGIILEAFGKSGTGKTAILSELGASAQSQGGEVRFDDPEGRLNRTYTEIYGVKIDDDNYFRPDTVNEMFDDIQKWKPNDLSKINVSCSDSLAALSTEMEMEDIDKMGMKRANDFTSCLRKTARLIAKNNFLIACSNHEKKDHKTGRIYSTGGKAPEFYATVRTRITPGYPTKTIIKTKTIYGKKQEKEVGIICNCKITKNSFDDPYREATFYIIFGYGIDDVRGNLVYIRDNGEKPIKEKEEKKNKNKLNPKSKKLKKERKVPYICPDGQQFTSIDKAITHIEDNDLEDELKEQVVDLWNIIQNEFKTERKIKKR